MINSKEYDTLLSDYGGYFRVIEESGEWVFQVARLDWPQPHRPEKDWIGLRRWKNAPSKESLRKAQKAALRSRRFFRRCGNCGAVQNAGYMHNQTICMGCSHSVYGVIY